MSLDIFLSEHEEVECPNCHQMVGGACVYTRNITHNLRKIAGVCGLYYPIWRPEEIGLEKAKYLIPVLESGIEELEKHSSFFKQFEPDNKWGTLEGFIAFCKDYLKACKDNPEAIITTSR